ILFFGISLLFALRNPAPGVFLFFIGANLLLWYFFTHQVDRFLYPATAAGAILAAGGFCWLRTNTRLYLRPAAALLLLIFTLLGVSHDVTVETATGPEDKRTTRTEINPYHKDAVKCLLGRKAGGDFLKEQMPVARCFEEINRLPERSVILFIGEARPFYVERRKIFWTVFDRNVFEEMAMASASTDVLAEELRARGVTHVFINYGEIERYDRTYAFVHDGRRYKGYFNM
ncbi:unnamed protein product, partial [marine sediment metagenome]